MRGVNLDLFDFDFDLTWAAFFLGPDETVYGRYGGRDATSPDSRMSLAGLHYAMTEVLGAHRSKIEDGRSKIEGRGFKIDHQDDFRSSTIDRYAAAQRRAADSCIHCHQVYDARREWLQTTGKWRLDEVWVHPLPENIGLTLNVDQGNRVQAVAKESAADRAGLRTGDCLQSVNGVAVASIADVQYGLQRAPAEGEIPLAWLREGRLIAARMNVSKGWRKTDIS